MKNCDLNLSGICVEIMDASGECPYRAKDKFAMADLAPADECFFAIHEIVPYYLTLKNGGYFKWEKDINSVVTQCPNTDIAVGICLRRDDANKIQAEVVSMKAGSCPKGYEKGSKILKSVIDKKNICLNGLDILLPYVLFLEAASRKGEQVEPVTVECLCSVKPTIFRLSLGGNHNE